MPWVSNWQLDDDTSYPTVKEKQNLSRHLSNNVDKRFRMRQQLWWPTTIVPTMPTMIFRAIKAVNKASGRWSLHDRYVFDNKWCIGVVMMCVGVWIPLFGMCAPYLHQKKDRSLLLHCVTLLIHVRMGQETHCMHRQHCCHNIVTVSNHVRWWTFFSGNHHRQHRLLRTSMASEVL